MKFPITLLIIGIFLFIKNKDEITSFMKLQDSKVVSMILILSLFVLIYICRKNVEGLTARPGCDYDGGGRCLNPNGGDTLPCCPNGKCPIEDGSCPPPSGGGGGGGGGDTGGGGQLCEQLEELDPCDPTVCKDTTCSRDPDLLFQSKDKTGEVYGCANCETIEPNKVIAKEKWCSRLNCAGNESLLCYNKLKEDTCANKKGGGSDCLVCIDEHQGPLRGAGCSQEDFDVYCRSNDDKYIEFYNSMDQPIYLLFESPIPEGIIFSVGKYNPSAGFQGSPGGIIKLTKGSYIEIPADLSVFVGGNRTWIAGMATISPLEPSRDESINTAGMTALEWTIKPDSITGDISAVDGFNINGKVEVFGDIKCSGERMIENKPDLKCLKQFQYMTGGMLRQDVKTCSLKKKITDKIANPPNYPNLNCASGDCIGCPFEDVAGCKQWDANNPNCEMNSEGKYGCMAWWSVAPDAMDWKQLFATDPNSSYYWAFAEQKIQGTPKENNPYPQEGGWLNSTGQKCITGALTGVDCNGYVITSEKKPIISCKIDPGSDFLLKFTITDIIREWQQ